MVGLVWWVCFARFGLVFLVWSVWFGLVNEDDLKRPLVPLKVAKAILELHLETIPGWSRSVRVSSGRSNSDNKADSVQLCWGWD